MSTEQNGAAIRHWVDSLNQGDLDGAASVLTPDFVAYFTGLPQAVQGPEGFKQVYGGFIRPAFPDQHITIDDQVIDGDKIGVHVYWTATHRGAFMGVPPTNRSVRVTGTGIFHFRDGKISAEWMQEDLLGLYQQINPMPPPAPPSG